MGLTLRLHLTPGNMELMAPVLTLWQCYKVVMPHFISHWSYCLCYESAYSSFLKYLIVSLLPTLYIVLAWHSYSKWQQMFHIIAFIAGE